MVLSSQVNFTLRERYIPLLVLAAAKLDTFLVGSLSDVRVIILEQDSTRYHRSSQGIVGS
jgi:hypothetical protein